MSFITITTVSCFHEFLVTKQFPSSTRDLFYRTTFAQQEGSSNCIWSMIILLSCGSAISHSGKRAQYAFRKQIFSFHSWPLFVFALMFFISFNFTHSVDTFFHIRSVAEFHVNGTLWTNEWQNTFAFSMQWCFADLLIMEKDDGIQWKNWYLRLFRPPHLAHMAGLLGHDRYCDRFATHRLRPPVASFCREYGYYVSVRTCLLHYIMSDKSD